MRKALAAVACLLALAACGDDDADDTTAPADDAPAAEAEGGAGDVLPVTAADFRFDPDALEAPAGTAVTIELTNDDGVAHTFTIADLDVDIAANPGQSASAEVTVDEAGEHEWVCRIHPSMSGTLTVTG